MWVNQSSSYLYEMGSTKGPKNDNLLNHSLSFLPHTALKSLAFRERRSYSAEALALLGLHFQPCLRQKILRSKQGTYHLTAPKVIKI